MSSWFTELLQLARRMAIASGLTHRQARPAADRRARTRANGQGRIIVPLWDPRRGYDKEGRLLAHSSMMSAATQHLPRQSFPSDRTGALLA